jgi:hypothetical protein
MMKKTGRRRSLVFIVGGLAAAAGPALAATITLTPVQDTTIFGDNTDFASGAGGWGFFGTIAQSSARRSLVLFDLSAIPAGATVTDASLSILVDRAQGPASVASLHRALGAWAEGTSDAGASGRGVPAAAGEATWLSNGSSLWSRAGGDFAPVASASTLVTGTGLFTWRGTSSLLADVQAWVDRPAANYGWFIVGDESGTTRTAARFVSSEGVGATVPTLSIQFTVPESPSPILPAPPPITPTPAASVREPGTIESLALALAAIGVARRLRIARTRP